MLLDNEGDSLAGPDALGMLASLGIVKGKPFAPDDKTRAILDKAAKTGYKMSRVIGFEDTHDGASLRVYPDRHWLNPIDNVGPHDAGNTNDLAFLNVAGNYRDLDARDWFFTNYYSISPGMVSKIPRRGLHDRLFRQRRKVAVGRIKLQADPSGEYPGGKFLVADALRSGERFRPRQRPALPLAGLPRQAVAERRR